MDLLSHIFLPLTILCLLKRKFDSRYLLLSLFAIFPDLDKLIRIPGLFHSLITLLPFALAMLLIEKRLTGNLKFSAIASFFLFSHLFLDLLDYGPVPLLFPFVKTGIGFDFPMKVVIGKGITFVDSPVEIVYEEPRMRDSYRIFSGYGFVSLILFAVVYFRNLWSRSRL